MEYKQSSRNPQYGRIFAYDKNGIEIQELDVLKLVVVHNGKEYKISDILTTAVKSEAELALHKGQILSLEAASKAQQGIIENLQQTNETLSQLVVLLDAKINALSIK